MWTLVASLRHDRSRCASHVRSDEPVRPATRSSSRAGRPRGDVHDPGREVRLRVGAGVAPHVLVDPDRADTLQPGGRLDHRGSVLAHRPHDRIPADPQLAGDLGDRAPARPVRAAAAGGSGQSPNGPDPTGRTSAPAATGRRSRSARPVASSVPAPGSPPGGRSVCVVRQGERASARTAEWAALRSRTGRRARSATPVTRRRCAAPASASPASNDVACSPRPARAQRPARSAPG